MAKKRVKSKLKRKVTLKKKVAPPSREIEALRGDIEDLKSKISSLNDKIKELEAKITLPTPEAEAEVPTEEKTSG